MQIKKIFILVSSIRYQMESRGFLAGKKQGFNFMEVNYWWSWDWLMFYFGFLITTSEKKTETVLNYKKPKKK